MNIHFNSFANHALFFLKENALPLFTAHQKRIVAIAALILGCLATYSLVRHLCFKAEPLNSEENDLSQKDFLDAIFSHAKKVDKEEGEDIFDLDNDTEIKENIKNDQAFEDKEKREERKPHENDELASWDKKNYPKGTLEEGEFQNGKLHGQGKRTYPIGSIEEGEFQNGELHGQGKRFYYSNHRIEEGEFRKGALYKSIYPQIRTSKQQVKLGDLSSPLDDLLKDPYLDPNDLGPSFTGITEQYIWFMRKLIFGFSIGQKKQIKEMSERAHLELKKMKKTLQGGHCRTNMLYVVLHLEQLIDKMKAAHQADSHYMHALQRLQSDLKRSLPIHKKSSMEEISKKLKEMKPHDRLFIPIGSKKHATLLSLQKMANGSIASTHYNTGRGVRQHVTQGLNIKACTDYLNTFRNYYPISKTYPPIDLETHQVHFESMMIHLLQVKNKSKSNINKIDAILEEYLGQGTAGPSKPVQINGTCSFQVLTEAFKDVFDSKGLYNTYKLDLLTHIQEEFQEITDAMQHLVAQNDDFKELYPLHRILLEENQEQIEITKQVLARTKTEA